MTQIVLPDSCKNSPRASLVCELVVARTIRDLGFVREWCDQGTTWDLVGDQVLTGPDEIGAAAATVFPEPVDVLTVETALSHGKFGAVTGTFQLESHMQWRFSEMFEFSGHSKAAKLKFMSSYWVTAS